MEDKILIKSYVVISSMKYGLIGLCLLFRKGIFFNKVRKFQFMCVFKLFIVKIINFFFLN